MAGFYPDVPGPKMSLDKDGTQFFWYNGAGVLTNPTSTQIGNITGANPYDSSTVTSVGANGTDAPSFLAAVFPDLRDVDGVFGVGFRLGSPSLETSGKWEYSYNTTNGWDGTWVEFVSNYNLPVFPLTGYRQNIWTASLTNVRGVRLKQGSSGAHAMNVATFHVYGKVSEGQNPHRLAFWHPTLDEELSATAFDWGDVPRSTTETRQFRIKNLSPDLTANTPRVAMTALHEATPTNVSQHALSEDNSTWVSQINLTNKAPEALSGVLYLRRTTLSNAQGGVFLMRVLAEATSWS